MIMHYNNTLILLVDGPTHSFKKKICYPAIKTNHGKGDRCGAFYGQNKYPIEKKLTFSIISGQSFIFQKSYSLLSHVSAKSLWIPSDQKKGSILKKQLHNLVKIYIFERFKHHDYFRIWSVKNYKNLPSYAIL